MKLHSRTISGALLTLTVIAAPAALASSSAVSAQTSMSTPAQTPTDVIAPDASPQAVEMVEPAPAEAIATVTAPDRQHVECVAKIIMHEAADEPRPGRVAVAQVIRARIRDGRFASDACGVARQRGQFFNVDAFDPPRNAAWEEAVAIATDTLQGAGPDVVPGALYFHASYSPMRGRARVGQIGGHVFYR